MEQRAFKLNRAVAIGSLVMVGIGCAAVFIEVGTAKSEMRETKGAVAEMRSEFKSLRVDVTELKTLRQDMATLRQDLNELRVSGSPGFRAHERQDDERVADIRMDLADIKDTLKRVTQVQLDFADLRANQAVLANKLDAIKEALDLHMRQIPGGVK